MTDYYSDMWREVTLDDAYVVSQDITALQAEARVLSYLQDTVPVVDVRQHPADYVTMTGVLEALDKGPQSHAAGRRDGARVPVWALACLFAGLVLVGASMVGYAYIQNM